MFQDYENIPYELYNESMCVDEVEEIIALVNETDEHREIWKLMYQLLDGTKN